jgi:hypothetical protein
LAGWPQGMRIIVGRERPHPGAQLSLFDERDGWRYQAIATNSATGSSRSLEARHRAHARVEDRIRHAKDTGLGRFPSREFTINQAWLTAATIAADLIAWTGLLALTGDAHALAACEPKALRYRFLHVPGRLTHSTRRRRLKIRESWPWAAAIVAVFDNIAAIPQPARPPSAHAPRNPENRSPAAPAGTTTYPTASRTSQRRSTQRPTIRAALMKDRG